MQRLPKKGGGAGQFADLSEGLARKRGGGVFEGGGWYPNAHYEFHFIFFIIYYFLLIYF